MSLSAALIQSLETQAYFFLFKYRLEFFTGFVLIFVGRRLYRAVYGSKYTTSGLILSPILYLGFTSSTFIGLSLEGLIICSVGFAVGLGLSGVLRGQLHFFEKKSALYYKRSVSIVVVWTIAFVLRLYLLLFYDITVGLVLSVILSYISGVITGEAFQIAVQKSMFDYRRQHSAPTETQEETAKD